MKLPAALLALVALCLPLAAAAQWQWLDKDGRKVFSDQAPPADVPARNILKKPAGAAAPAATPPAPAATAAAAPASAPGGLKLSGKDKALEEKKKQAEAAEAAKRQALEENNAKIRADNCERTKRAMATFDSGVRIATTNAQGEREYMSDAARAAERKRLADLAGANCGPAPKL